MTKKLHVYIFKNYCARKARKKKTSLSRTVRILALPGVTWSRISRIDGPIRIIFSGPSKRRSVRIFLKFSRKTCARFQNVLISRYIRKIGSTDLYNVHTTSHWISKNSHLFNFLFKSWHFCSSNNLFSDSICFNWCSLVTFNFTGKNWN